MALPICELRAELRYFAAIEHTRCMPGTPATRLILKRWFLRWGKTVSCMHVDVREALVTLPLRCALCWKSNYFKTSSVLWSDVHRVFHRIRGKCFERVARESEFA